MKAYLGRTSDSIRSRVKKLKKVDIRLLKTKLVDFICTKRELSERNGLRLKEPVITDIQPLSKYNAVIDTSFERELSSIERLMKFRECVIAQDLEICPSILSKFFLIVFGQIFADKIYFFITLRLSILVSILNS